MHITTIPRHYSADQLPAGQTLKQTAEADKTAQRVLERLEGAGAKLRSFDEEPVDRLEGVGRVQVEDQSYRWLAFEGELEFDPESGDTLKLAAQHGPDQLLVEHQEEESLYQLITPKKSYDLVENHATGTLTLTET